MVFKTSSPMSDPGGYMTWDKVEEFVRFVDRRGSKRDALLVKCLAYSGRRVGEWIGTQMRKCTNCGELYYAERFSKDKEGTEYVKSCPRCLRESYIYVVIGGVRIEDIAFDKGKITFSIEKKYSVKKGTYRKIKKLPRFLMEEIKKYVKLRGLKDSDYLFQSGYSLLSEENERLRKPISRQRVFQIIRKYGLLSGIYKVGKGEIHPHHFRHSFTTHASKKLKTPHDLRKLQVYLEHSDIGITENYLKLAKGEEDEVVDRVFG